MIVIKEPKILSEKNFELFRHEGFLCAVSRMSHGGNLNGYVAVEKNHPLYKKHYGDKFYVENIEDVKFNGNYMGLLAHSFDAEKNNNELSIDLFLEVHGGITYADESLYNIDESVFSDLWWFGFDTAHSGDLRPFETDIDRKYPFSRGGDTYRDFEYVKAETIKLAEQLKKLQ